MDPRVGVKRVTFFTLLLQHFTSLYFTLVYRGTKFTDYGKLHDYLTSREEGFPYPTLSGG